MVKQKLAEYPLVLAESQDQVETKIYHAPQLTEWGNLQELTRGDNGIYFDQHGAGTTSNPLGRPIPVDPNNPRLPPIPKP